MSGKIMAVITFTGFFTLLAFTACENKQSTFDPLPPGGEPELRLSGLGDCQSSEEPSLASDRNDNLDFTVENGKVSFTHSGAVFNCCMDSVSLEIAVEGTVLRVTENEHASNPCFCICPYTVYGEITDLDPGTYTLEIYSDISGDDPPYCSATIVVE